MDLWLVPVVFIWLAIALGAVFLSDRLQKTSVGKEVEARQKISKESSPEVEQGKRLLRIAKVYNLGSCISGLVGLLMVLFFVLAVLDRFELL